MSNYLSQKLKWKNNFTYHFHHSFIIPAGRSQILNSPQNFALTRITETNINFGTFQYQSKYNFDNVHETNIVTMIENFTDSKTNKIRQNNHTFYIEPLEYRNGDDIINVFASNTILER